MTQQISTFGEYSNVLTSLNIDPKELGFVGLDTLAVPMETFDADVLYWSADPKLWWVDGWVGDNPHLTLKYGLLMTPDIVEYYAIQVLKGWQMEFEKLKIEKISEFKSPYETELYSAIVAEIELTDGLLDVHRRLSFLPHIDTFTPYKPHVTLAYVWQEHADECITIASERLVGLELIPKQLNFGENKPS